jgi:hypothetical protein
MKFQKNEDGSISLKINDEEVTRKDESYCFKLLSSLEKKSKELNLPFFISYPFIDNLESSIISPD